MNPEASAPQTLDIERLVFLVNPNSTRSGSVGAQVEELKNASIGNEFVIIETEPDPAANAEQLESTLKPGDVLVVAGGDGTVHEAINVLATSDMASREIPLLPLFGGNGNDLAHMLNGRASHRPASAILRAARVVPIYPIHGHFENETGELDRFGMCYAGFGATASGAMRLNDAAYRNRPFYTNEVLRQLYENESLIRELVRSPRFVIEEHGEQISLYERTIANGERMAKFGRLPVHLAERQLFVMDVKTKNLPAVAAWIGGLVTHPLVQRSKGRYLETDDELAFTTRTPVAMHFDAEATMLPADTHVRIRQHVDPIYALSTR